MWHLWKNVQCPADQSTSYPMMQWATTVKGGHCGYVAIFQFFHSFVTLMVEYKVLKMTAASA